MPKNYYQTGGTLANQLDLAWSDYQSLDVSPDDKAEALKFMIQVLDIKSFSQDVNLFLLIRNLMKQRDLEKANNPEFIPTLASGSYNLHYKSRALEATPAYKTYYDKDNPDNKPDPEVEQLFQNGSLLDVSNAKVVQDQQLGITMLNPQERARYRVIISDGKIYKEGKLFDSSSYIAHDKNRYAAFTFSTNGEFCIFNHLRAKEDPNEFYRKLVHSSMNSSAPLLEAGEMVVELGFILVINSSSGHYEPSIFSIARFLEYLADKEVKLSITKVYFDAEPDKAMRLDYKPVDVEGDIYFSVKAEDIVLNMNALIRKHVNQVGNYLKEIERRGQSSSCLSSAPADPRRVQLAQDFITNMEFCKNLLKSSLSIEETKLSLAVLEKVVDDYIAENRKIGVLPERNLGNRFSAMKQEIHELREKFERVSQDQDDERQDALKKGF